MNSLVVYRASDGEATKRLYAELEQLGPAGSIALNLFRACKNSERAKKYRGGNGNGSYRSQAYERKQWAIDNLQKVLQASAEPLGILWGWAEDRAQEFHSWVLYVEIPTGQVSFHTARRGAGPDFPKQWDGVRDMAPMRICRWIEQIKKSPPG